VSFGVPSSMETYIPPGARASLHATLRFEVFRLPTASKTTSWRARGRGYFCNTQVCTAVHHTTDFDVSVKGWTVYCAVGLHEERLNWLDYEYGSVDVYAYPSGAYVYSYTNGIDPSFNPMGTAIQP
jgi:hypothetical protein